MAAKSFPILFVAGRSLADAVLSSGLLKKLCDEVPNSRFTVVASPATAALFADLPKLEQVVVTPKKPPARLWLGLFGPVRARRWALVVDVPNRVTTGSLRPRQKALRQRGAEPTHKVIEAAQLLRLEDDPPAPFFFTSPETEARAAALTAGSGPILAMAPGAEWMGKTWPGERFAELARRLLSPAGALAGGRLMVLGGHEDHHAVEPVKSGAPRERVIDLLKTDPLTAYAALKHAKLFVGNDTGWTHLAAAAGTPTLGLFGPSDEVIGHPWGPRARALRGARGLEEIRKVDPHLSGLVCHMMDLSVDSVLAAAEDLIEETANHA